MMRKSTRNLVNAALMLAVSWLLPMLVAPNQFIAQSLSPMHIPILLCGFICDLPWAMVVGFLAPFLRHLTLGIPQNPVLIAMAFELCTYGLVTSLLFRILRCGDIAKTYASLIMAMIAGRGVYGVVMAILAGFYSVPFTFQIFLTDVFLKSIWGIVFHIAIIPPIVLALRRAKLLK